MAQIEFGKRSSKGKTKVTFVDEDGDMRWKSLIVDDETLECIRVAYNAGWESLRKQVRSLLF